MALFIGGRADGRRMAVEGNARYVRVPYHLPMRVSELRDEPEMTLTMPIENYVEVMRGVYVHEELNRLDPIQLLIEGYRHETSK